MLLPISYIPKLSDTEQISTGSEALPIKISDQTRIPVIPATPTPVKPTPVPRSECRESENTGSSTESSDSDSEGRQVYIIPQRRVSRPSPIIHHSPSTLLDTTAGMYDTTDSTLNRNLSTIPSTPTPLPRRSSRKGRPPNKYGEWVQQVTPVYFV